MDKCYGCGYSGKFNEEYCGVGFTVKGCTEEDFHNHQTCPQCGKGTIRRTPHEDIQKELANVS